LEDSGFSAEAFPAFGVFSGARLCAAASYSIWKPSIAHIIVATHPEHRRRGFAKATIHALAKDALDRGLILQWRAVAWNVSSLALAQTLGFKHYCSTIFARIHH
jgi:predicted GNAT family acetyltransferase